MAERDGTKDAGRRPRPTPEDIELDQLLGQLDDAFDDPPGLDDAPTPLVSRMPDPAVMAAAKPPAVSGKVLAELLELRRENERLQNLVALVREVRRLETAFEERGNQADYRAFQQARNRLDAILARS